jgi:hypothetical protein
MALLRAGLAIAPDVHFISVGRGQSGAYGGKCPSFRRGGLAYDLFMKQAVELRGRVTFGGLFVMLGATESTSLHKDFPDCIKAVVSDIRNDLGQPTLPLLMNDYDQGARGEYGPTGTVGRSIMPYVRMVPSRVSDSALVPNDGAGMQDYLHFNMAGQNVWAGRALGIMKERGWTTWPAPVRAGPAPVAPARPNAGMLPPCGPAVVSGQGCPVYDAICLRPNDDDAGGAHGCACGSAMTWRCL